MPSDFLVSTAQANNVVIATAESCTGGMVAAAITDIPGASNVFDRGFVTYSNEAKHDMLDVPLDLFDTVGAVSEEVAIAMAEGALKHSSAQLSISVTGIAGPDGGSEEKPVGLVYIASAEQDGITLCEKYLFEGNRASIRKQATEKALEVLLDCLK